STASVRADPSLESPVTVTAVRKWFMASAFDTSGTARTKDERRVGLGARRKSPSSRRALVGSVGRPTAARAAEPIGSANCTDPLIATKACLPAERLQVGRILTSERATAVARSLYRFVRGSRPAGVHVRRKAATWSP